MKMCGFKWAWQDLSAMLPWHWDWLLLYGNISVDMACSQLGIYWDGQHHWQHGLNGFTHSAQGLNIWKMGGPVFHCRDQHHHVLFIFMYKCAAYL